ncbi:MAG: DUF177 domain-containing protein [Deltaproteobacteria bacterium]|nr:DUF177 domain-containing protein [Deltaproteobacteria bacterium]
MTLKQKNHEVKGRFRGPARIQLDPSVKGGARVDLDIRIDDIPDEGMQITEDLPAGWMTLLLGTDIPKDDEPWVATIDGKIDLKLRKEVNTIRLSGSSDFHLEHCCVRCLEKVTFQVQPHFELRLVEHRPEWEGSGLIELDPQGLSKLIEEEDETGLELDHEEDDLATYKRRTVDLPRLLREQIFLDLPMHPSCRSDEARTETPCAEDLNDGQQKERDRWVASRWAGLEAMRDQFDPSAERSGQEPEDK